jgi:hypothetical protein
MTDRIVPSPYPDDEPVQPTRRPGDKEDPEESDPLDDDIEDEDPVLLP